MALSTAFKTRHEMVAERKARVSRIKSGLNRVRGLTPEGKNWLIQSIDPFHDTDVPNTGYPDMDGSKTIVERYKQSLSLVAPTAANWDANIFILPETNAFVSLGMSLTDGVWSGTAAGATITTGCVNAITVPTTTSATWTPAGGLVANAVWTQNALPAAWVYGSSRLVGIGIEVINTTAPNNAQGVVTCYKMPQNCTPTTILRSTATANTFFPPVYCESSRMPPLTYSDALSLADTQEWEAIHGGYIFGSQYDTANPIKNEQRGVRLFQDVNSSSFATTAIMSSVAPNVVIPTTAVALTYNGNTTGFKSAPFNTTGLYFTGLSATSTLTVDIRYFVEYVPTQLDTTLIGLARASPRFDPIALELYGRIVSKLPPGCPRYENPLGEWFDRICDAVGNVGTFISPVIPQGAYFATAARALKGINKSSGGKTAKKAIREVRKVEQKEKKLQKQVNKLKKK